MPFSLTISVAAIVSFIEVRGYDRSLIEIKALSVIEDAAVFAIVCIWDRN